MILFGEPANLDDYFVPQLVSYSPILNSRPYFFRQCYKGHGILAVEVDVENGFGVWQIVFVQIVIPECN